MPEGWNVVDAAALRSRPDEFADAAAKLTSSFDRCDVAAEALITVANNGWNGFEGESANALGFRDEADYPDHFKGRAFFPGLPNTMFLDLAIGLLPVRGRIGGQAPAISQAGALPRAPRPTHDPFGPRPKVTNPDTGSFTPYPSRPPGVRTAHAADAHVPAEIFRFDPKVFG